jgi:hypothetical protein
MRLSKATVKPKSVASPVPDNDRVASDPSQTAAVGSLKQQSAQNLLGRVAASRLAAHGWESVRSRIAQTRRVSFDSRQTRKITSATKVVENASR